MNGVPESQMCEGALVVNPTIGIEEKRSKRPRYKTLRLKCKTCKVFFFVEPYKKYMAKYCSNSCRSRDLYPKAKAAGFSTKGKKSWNAGRKWSEEARKKMSISHLGQKVSDETRKKISISSKGRKSWNIGKGDLLKSKISKNISVSIRQTIHNGSKKMRHWENLVGWTFQDFKKVIEKKFSPGMNWGNHGEWEIDHKIPIAAFNFNRPEDIDFKRCWALKNLQPLWRKENNTKRDKLLKPFQPALKF